MSETYTPIFYAREPIRAGWCNLYSRGPHGAQECIAGVVKASREQSVEADVHEVAYARVRITPKVRV